MLSNSEIEETLRPKIVHRNENRHLDCYITFDEEGNPIFDFQGNELAIQALRQLIIIKELHCGQLLSVDDSVPGLRLSF